MQTCKYFSIICAAALLGGAVGVRAQETDAQAKARQALREKMAELDAQDQQGKASKPRTPAPAPAPRVEPAPKPTPPPPVAKPTPPPVVPPPANPATEDQTRNALRQKIQETETAQPKPTPPPVAKPQTAQQPTPPPVAQPTPTPAPSSKEAKLAQLLAQYKSDQISAEQYHTQRAAILSEK